MSCKGEQQYNMTVGEVYEISLSLYCLGMKLYAKAVEIYDHKTLLDKL